MKQLIQPPEIPDKPDDYALEISSVYKLKSKLIMISFLSKITDKTKVPVKSEGVEVDVPKELPVTHYVIVKKEDKTQLVKEEKVDSFEEIKGKVKHGECVYGQDLRSYKDQLMLSVYKLPLLNMKWFKSNLNFYTGFMGVGVLAAMGFFAFRKFGADVENKVSDTFTNRPGQ